MTTNNSTVGFSSPEEYLDYVNSNMRMAVLPVTILIGFENIVGLIGNILILLVYSRRYEKSNFRYFVLFMAIIDLTSCLTCVPGELFSQLNWYRYEHAWICKIKSYFNVLGAWGSASILLLLAFDRHRKICRPLAWQIQPSLALKLCSTAVVISAIVSAPITVLWGKQTYLYENGDISVNVSVCEKSSEFADNTLYPLLYIICVYILPVGVMMVVITTLNVLTARRLFCNRLSKTFSMSSTMTNTHNSSQASISTISDNVCTHDGKTAIQNIPPKYTEIEDGNGTDGPSQNGTETTDSNGCEVGIATEKPSGAENNNNRSRPTRRFSAKFTNYDNGGRKTSVVTFITLNDIDAQNITNDSNNKNNNNNRNSTGSSPDTVQERTSHTTDVKKHTRYRKSGSMSSLIRFSATSTGPRSASFKCDRFRGRLDGSELRVKRKTIIMLVLTTVFVITMSMYVILISIIADQNILQEISNSEKAIYFLFFRLYFINCVINPFLYGFMDPRFRSGIKKMFCSK